MNTNVDNLNFKVILDDDQFNRKIKELESVAKRFNASMSDLLNLEQASQQWSQKDVENNRRAHQAKVDEARAQEKINREKIKTDGLQRKINAQIDAATQGYKTQSRILQELKGMALGYLSVHGSMQFLGSLIRITGEFEKERTTLGAMLGNLNEAENIITRIKGLAIESPFTFKELTGYAKQLSAFSVPAEELYDTTKMLADVSAGLGVGMDRLVLAYGQVRSAAFLRGQEVRQFTEAGIPILSELAKQFEELEGRAVSAGEVFDKISARLVPFEMVAKVFKDMTSEGGKFFNMQEIQSQTLSGKYENLKDAIEQTINAIGESQSDKLKGVLDWTRELVQNYEELGKKIVELVTAFGAYKATLATIQLLTGTFAQSNVKLVNSFKNASKWLLANPYTLIAAGITAAGLATYKWVTHLSEAERVQESVRKSNEKFTEELASEEAMLNSLYAKLELTTEGTLEHDKAKAKIMQRYSPYIEQLKQEGIEVNSLADIYGNLAQKIKEALHEKYYESSMQDLDSVYKQIESEVQKRLRRSFESNRKEYILSEKDKMALNMYVLGGLDKDKTFQNLTDSAKRYFSDFSVFLENQRKTMASANESYINGLDDLSDAYQHFKHEVDEEPIDLSLFAQTVQDTLKKFGATEEKKGKFASLWADNTTEYYGYLEKIRNGYEEVNEKIKDVGTTQRGNLADLQKQKEAIEAIAKALGVSLVDPNKRGGGGKSQAQIDLELQIDLVKKLQDAYDKLEPYVDEKTMKSTLSKFFPDAKQEWIESLDFTTILKSLADELEKYDKNAAERLRNTIGKTGIDEEVERLKKLNKKYQETSRTVEEYFNLLRKWSAEEFNLNGKGISLDISKIASDLSSKINEIKLSATKAKELFGKIDLDSEDEIIKVKEIFTKEFGADAWDLFWNSYTNQGVSAIETLAEKQKEYERKLAQERIDDLASKYVSETLQGIDLNDWSDKTISQIENIRQKLSNLVGQDVRLPESIKTALASLGLSTDVLIAKIKELFSAKLDDATIEKFKALKEVVNDISAKTSSLGDQIEVLADTMGDNSLKDFGRSLKNIAAFAETITEIFSECDFLIQSFSDSTRDAQQEVSDLAGSAKELANSEKDAAEKMENIADSTDLVTMVVKLGITLFTRLVDGINETQQALHKSRMAAIEYANALKEIEYNSIMESHVSSFGTDEYRKMVDAMAKVKEYQEAIVESQKKVGVTEGDIGDFVVDNAGKWGMYADTTQKAWERIKDLGEGDIIADTRNWWQRYWGTGGDSVLTFNMSDYINANGMVNGEALKALYEQYGEYMSDSNAEAISEIIAQYDLWKAAVEDITSYLSDMFGDTASSIADTFIASFKSSERAALEYGEIMDTVATNIAKSIIESMLLQNVFTDEMEKEAAEKLASGDAAGAMAIVDDAMEAAKALTPQIQELLDSLRPYLQMDEMAGQSLGDGIKGITEDTANLLASYLNAIRADVSYSKVLWQNMDTNLQTLAAALANFSVPSLMEYQQLIAANTLNTANHTREILDTLTDLLVSGNEGSAIRVYM